MRISQILNAVSGYNDREKERVKADQIIAWETTRWQTWVLWNLNVTKKGRLNDPKKLIKFEWDKKDETKIDWDKINSLFPDRIDGDK